MVDLVKAVDHNHQEVRTERLEDGLTEKEWYMHDIIYELLNTKEVFLDSDTIEGLKKLQKLVTPNSKLGCEDCEHDTAE